ncbi:MAG TPA: 4Fe-4S dicluster domain-containing protein [Chloroflexota bacterium]|nr:4Fe-4S dicluster domain-containing protein [Chloroflexota bacterium]
MSATTPTARGFLTDTSLCIGCKACEVACKQWNQLPMDDDPEGGPDGFRWEGTSYDNTHALGATTWRHVTFAELPGAGGAGGQTAWMMMSDVCKHCAHAGCLEACPTGAIIRTEFDTVVIQQDICNGCGYCVPSCPYGVVELNTTAQSGDHKAHKCTLCYDRLKDGLEPACAKACPTDSIQFGDLEELRAHAERRVRELRGRGLSAYHYGTSDCGGSATIGALGASFILLDDPARYNLPAHPILPQSRTFRGILSMAVTALALGAATAWSLASRGEP